MSSNSYGIDDTPVINKIVDEHVIDNGLDSILVAPLYAYHDDGTRTANFNPKELKELLTNLEPYCYVDEESDLPGPQPDFVITAVDVLDYIYGVLHSPAYREKYKEFLKIDFPRVPAPADHEEFTRLVDIGRHLRELHLMTSPLLSEFITTFPVPGSGEVEKLRYEDGKVWINDTQYFGGVPELAWNFYVGGYQPAQKWLKDRKGRPLGNKGIEHYQKIIKILVETDRLMRKIDA